MRYYEDGLTQSHRAQRAWVILAGVARFQTDTCGVGKGLITFGELANLMGYTRQAGITLSQPLGLIRDLCQANDVPLLNYIVVNRGTGMTAMQGAPTDLESHQAEHKRVAEFDWFKVRRPRIKDFDD